MLCVDVEELEVLGLGLEGLEEPPRRGWRFGRRGRWLMVLQVGIGVEEKVLGSGSWGQCNFETGRGRPHSD